MNETLNVAARDTAYQYGYYTGRTVFVLLIVAGILKCISLARKPNCNAKCAISLALMLGTFALASALQAIVAMVPDMSLIAGPVLGLLIFGCFVTGIVFAIMGLIEYSKNRELYIQGKGQAITALVFGSIFLVLFGAGFVKGFSAASAKRKALETKQPALEAMLTFDEMNYKFKSLPKPWAKIDATKINPLSTLGYMRAKPQIFFILIAESAGIDLNATSSQLAEIAKGNLESAATSAKFVKEVPETHNGVEGIRLETEAQLKNLNVYYVHWVITTNGYAYQLMCWGGQKDREQVQKEATTIFSRFELIDPTKTSFEEPAEAPAKKPKSRKSQRDVQSRSDNESRLVLLQ